MKKNKGLSLFDDLLLETHSCNRIAREGSIKWLNQVDRDLKASVNLYQDELYEQSVNLLQQGFEKLVKSYYLYGGKFNEKEDRKHTFIIDALERDLNKELLIKMDDFIKQYTDVENDVLYCQTLKILYDENIKNMNKQKIMKMSASEFNLLFTLINQIENRALERNVLIDIQGNLRNKSYRHMFKCFIQIKFKKRVKNSQIRKETTIEKISQNVKERFITIRFLMAGFITCNHYLSSKYPGTNVNELDSSSYIPGLGIVDYCLELNKIAEEFAELHRNNISIS